MAFGSVRRSGGLQRGSQGLEQVGLTTGLQLQPDDVPRPGKASVITFIIAYIFQPIFAQLEGIR